MQFNTVLGSTTIEQGSSYLATTSQSFDLNQSLVQTDRLYYDIVNTASTTPLVLSDRSTQKKKTIKKNIPAIKIGEKLLVIKGFSEESSNILTALEKENITLEQINSSQQEEGDITPTTIEVSVDEDADTVVLNQEGDISEYEVVSGDTIESIAKNFNITVETVLWANDLKRQNPIKIGQKLVILPVSGVSYKIRNGDTISEISEKFNISQKGLTEFNNLEDGKLIIGDIIVIPGGTITVKDNGNTVVSKSIKVNNQNTANKNYFGRPVSGGVRTQGIHGHNGIDIASSYGTPILAAQDGRVSLVRGLDGWNGGYGNYVVITHEKGVQTLYAHMSDIRVSQGQTVTKGQRVGSMGSTGQSTGVHLHFEVRGAKNPF